MTLSTLIAFLVSLLLGAPAESEPTALAPIPAQEESEEETEAEEFVARPAALAVAREARSGKHEADRRGASGPPRKSEALGAEPAARPRLATGAGRAHDPRPADRASNVARCTTLHWIPGAGAVSHDVWFGRSPERLVFQGNQLESEFRPPDLARRSRYSWRVDEVDALGKVTPGPVWTFRTARR